MMLCDDENARTVFHKKKTQRTPTKFFQSQRQILFLRNYVKKSLSQLSCLDEQRPQFFIQKHVQTHQTNLSHQGSSSSALYLDVGS